MNFSIFLFFRKNEKTPETLDFTGFSGGVFGVPEVIRTPDLPLRRRSLYPAELRVHVPENSVFSRVFRDLIVMISFGFLLTDRPVFGLSC